MKFAPNEYKPPAEVLLRRNIKRFYAAFLMLAICVLLYYFGELVDFLGLEALRWGFFYSVHDVHRLFFLAPIVYTAYFFGTKATVIMIILTICSFMPRALFISPYPDPMLRTLLFSIVAAGIGYFIARESDRRKRLETLLQRNIEQTLRVLDTVEEGVLLIGQDYTIRFVNAKLKEDLGEGTGSLCYSYLRKQNSPCSQLCRLTSVPAGDTIELEYVFKNGQRYKVIALPYTDTDGTVCQLSVFRKITKQQ